MREVLSHLVHVYLGCLITITILIHVHAQNQLGFISIDCGRREASSYTDATTGLIYVSDTAFLDKETSGITNIVSYDYYDDSFGERFYAVRSFPEGDRNCYTLNPDQGKDSKYLVRAQFLYGNYDDKDEVPSFDLHIGANKWGTVKPENASTITTMEIIFIPSSDYLMVCLVKTGHGMPFISVLELRPLKGSTYETANQAAVLYRRLDFGSTSNPIRYKDDVHDRIWEPKNFTDTKVLRTRETIGEKNDFQPSSTVMATAVAPKNISDPLIFYTLSADITTQYYFYFYFSEVEKLEANQSREFDIYYNDNLLYGPFSPKYLEISTIYNIVPIVGDEKMELSFIKSKKSNLPPSINAVEIYYDPNFLELQTDEQDVVAMINVKSIYGVKKNWQGDPCAPKAYMWDNLNCSSVNGTEISLRITSLDLSSSGLTGEITFVISNLKMIRFLNLSNNNLNGSIPEFLSKLKFLKVLDLGKNNFTGSVPLDLIKRYNKGSLLLSIDGNPYLISSNSGNGKSHSKIVPLLASAASLLVLLIALLVGWRLFKIQRGARKENKGKALRKIGSALEPKNHEFTYSEIVTITDNFDRVIGRGGFGTVYHGYLNDTQVAVKMLSESSAQGYKEFQAEVKLLLRVHHVNLTSLIGYCFEDKYMGLIYEYMTNGNLGRYLSGNVEHSLSWKDRLRVAVDAAQGLEYLHHGCKPPVIHRDIKTTNILLNEKFEAKLADFGLSRAFTVEDGCLISTAVAGTPGYLDPECFKSDWLSEKSDVYSFGVVLLEMITGQPVVVKIDDDDREYSHISQRVKAMLRKGDIDNIVDPSLHGCFHLNSVWKAVETAMSCVQSNSVERPRMNQVVMELTECLALEMASQRGGIEQSKDSASNITLNLDSDLNPLAR